MSDLTPAQWREIEAASFRVAGNGHDPQRQCIALGVLRNIIKKSRRTNDQNALLWALYSDAMQQGGETLGGWTTEDIHEYMLGEYHGWQVHEAFGQKRKKPAKRSSRLTKQEFGDFLAFVVQRFAEHGIILELPGEQVA